jgi:hypothetical protein
VSIPAILKYHAQEQPEVVNFPDFEEVTRLGG